MSEVLSPHIEIREGPRGPKARIAGKGIKVQFVAVWHTLLRMSAHEIASEHNLTLGEVHAALAYYYDHKEELDKQNRDDEEFAAELKKTNPSLVERKLREIFGDPHD